MEYIVRHSLGRNGHLGDLYNAVSDQFLGENLFLNPLPTSFIRTEDVADGPKMTIPDYYTLDQNFRMLQVDPTSQLNVLCLHTGSLPGSGQFLIDSDVSYQWGDKVRQSIAYTVPTKTQQFDPLDRHLLAHVNVDAINRTQATHVVTKIKWGANAILTLKDEAGLINYDGDRLERDLYRLARDIKEKFIKSQCITSENNGIDFSLTADIEPHGLPVTSVEEALIFMRGIPDILKNFYNNLGKPLVFTLVPLKEIMKTLNLPVPLHSLIFREISDNDIDGCVEVFANYNWILKALFDLEEIIWRKNQNFYFCDYSHFLDDIITLRRNVIAYKAYVKKMLGNSVLAARMGCFHTINKIKNDATKYYWDWLEPTYRKMKSDMADMHWCEDIRKPGVDGINPNPDFNFYTGPMCFENKKNWSVWKAFVLFTRCDFKHTERNFWAHLHFFISLKEMNKSAEMWIVDLDQFPEFHLERTRVVEMVIRDRMPFVLSEDYFKDTSNNGLNLLRADSFEPVTEQPVRRGVFRSLCPRNISTGTCDDVSMETDDSMYWHCAWCRERVEYGFDKYFYCRCGRSHYKKNRFRCRSEKHGGYIAFSFEMFWLAIRFTFPRR